MLKLALCDDEPGQRGTVSGLLQEYAGQRPELAVRLSVFSSGLELLSALEEKGDFDLYVLDVVMPELSGIDLGIKLREMGSLGAIIYLTISPEYAVDSYAAQAFYYLMKPVAAQKLYQVLDQAVETLEKQRAACVTVKTKNGLRLVRMDHLLYAELSDRAVRYHLSNGDRVDSITLRNSFQEEVTPLLADSRFFQCGASFVVNLYYVTGVERGALRLDSGKRVPLARGLTAQARRQWSNYWLNGPGR